MVGIIIVSENQEAKEMLKTVERLLGRQRAMTSVILKQGKNPTQMHAQLKRALQRVNHRKGVVLLTDFFGSTQCNVCCRVIRKGHVELITGFNLAMLVKLATVYDKMDLSQLCRFIHRYGRQQIRYFNSRRCL